jgi:magnesium-transporting ATPase (P-type)
MEMKAFDVLLISAILLLLSIILIKYFKIESLSLPISSKSFQETPFVVFSLSYFLVVVFTIFLISLTVVIINHFEKKGGKIES